MGSSQKEARTTGEPPRTTVSPEELDRGGKLVKQLSLLRKALQQGDKEKIDRCNETIRLLTLEETGADKWPTGTPVMKEELCTHKQSERKAGKWSCLMRECRRPYHSIKKCLIFLSLSVDERVARIRKAGLCSGCLTTGHEMEVPECPVWGILVGRCKIKGCTQKHHALLHKDPEGTVPEGNEPDPLKSGLVESPREKELPHEKKAHKEALTPPTAPGAVNAGGVSCDAAKDGRDWAALSTGRIEERQPPLERTTESSGEWNPYSRAAAVLGPGLPPANSRGGVAASGTRGLQDTSPSSSSEGSESPRFHEEGAPCILQEGCGGDHFPGQCPTFEKLPPDKRLEKILQKRLCQLCLCHSDGLPCVGRRATCEFKGCIKLHHTLLHEALGERKGFVLMVSEQEAEGSPRKEKTRAVAQDYEGWRRTRPCRQMVPLEVSGVAERLQASYDWGSPTTIIREEAARRVGLKPVRSLGRLIKMAGGEIICTDQCYFVPMVDWQGNVQAIRAYGVDAILHMDACPPPLEDKQDFPELEPHLEFMGLPEGPLDLLVGLDNAAWLPSLAAESQNPRGGPQLMRSAFGERYMVMGSWGPDAFPLQSRTRRIAPRWEMPPEEKRDTIPGPQAVGSSPDLLRERSAGTRSPRPLGGLEEKAIEKAHAWDVFSEHPRGSGSESSTEAQGRDPESGEGHSENNEDQTPAADRSGTSVPPEASDDESGGSLIKGRIENYAELWLNEQTRLRREKATYLNDKEAEKIHHLIGRLAEIKIEELESTTQLVEGMVREMVPAVLRTHQLEMEKMFQTSRTQSEFNLKILESLQTVERNLKTSFHQKGTTGGKVEPPHRQDAPTTAPAAATTPVAAQKETFKCPVEGCQQPKHRLRHCYVLQDSPARDRWSMIAHLGLCRKCLELDHGRSDGKCTVVAYKSAEGSKMICPKKKCKGSHHYLLHIGPKEKKGMRNSSVPLERQGSLRTSGCLQDMMVVQQKALAGSQDMSWCNGYTGGGTAVTGRFEVEANADGNNESAPRSRESASSGSRPLSGEDRELLH